MKKLLLITTLLCVLIFPAFGSSIIKIDTLQASQNVGYISIPNNKKIKNTLGRRLTIKEKIALAFIKVRYKKGLPIDPALAEKANKNAIFGFVFALLGIFVFPLFIIPAYVLSSNALKKEKEQPGLLTSTNKTLAQISKIISIVYAILLVILIAIIIIVLAGWRR